MEFITIKVFIGLIVGFLIGLSGLGGGVLLLPVLIFGLQVPPILAVGSDAAFNFLTKIPSSAVHLLKGTVRGKLVFVLAIGSVPGCIIGVRLLQLLQSSYGAEVQTFIKSAVGFLLIVVSSLLLLQRRIESQFTARSSRKKSMLGAVIIGFGGGILVGITSVGSGSIIMLLLLMFYGYQPKVMVGTDIVHAMILTGCTSLLHFRLGNVDPRLVACLLLGSIPGGIIGSYFSTRVPVLWLRRIVCAILFATGARMITVLVH